MDLPFFLVVGCLFQSCQLIEWLDTYHEKIIYWGIYVRYPLFVQTCHISQNTTYEMLYGQWDKKKALHKN